MQNASLSPNLIVSPQNHLSTLQHPSSQMVNQEEEPLTKINLRELREKNRQTEQVIKSIETKIIYMKNKQEKTVKRVLNIKRKLNSLQNVRSKTKQFKQKYTEEKKKQEQNIIKKTQFNKLIKDHLKYNKKIVMTLMNQKIHEDVKIFKDKNNKLEVLIDVQRQNMIEHNIEKANKVRMEHIDSHQRRKMYFLEKLYQFKQLKDQKLKQEIRQRERQQQMISDLQQKQKMLLQRLSASQKFRIKCQQEYEEVRNKYKSFYEAAKGFSRAYRSSHDSRMTQDNEGKADIFIS